MKEIIDIKMCTCGHPFNAHIEFGTTYRVNGPETKKACKLCNCWKPVLVK